MKLPTIEKKQITLNLGGQKIFFSKMNAGKVLQLTDKKDYQKLPQSEKIIYFLAVCLDYDENTLEEKIEFIKNIDLEDISELERLASELGLGENKKK